MREAAQQLTGRKPIRYRTVPPVVPCEPVAVAPEFPVGVPAELLVALCVPWFDVPPAASGKYFGAFGSTGDVPMAVPADLPKADCVPCRDVPPAAAFGKYFGTVGSTAC